MENSPDVPLEEITWRSPQHVQAMGGFLHSNNILFYFAESPFFDATSNNASLTIQAMHNENLRHFIETREAFEGRLKTMQGTEFVVAHDPLQEEAAAIAAGSQPKEASNVWVIRKQIRRRPGMEEEVRTLATYFIVGDFVYMAPSVLSVVGRRMLSTVTSLTKVLSTASPLLMFSPSHGHTYMPPTSKSIESSQSNQEPAQQQSKETTPIPSASATAKPTDTATSHLSAAEIQNARNLEDAMNLVARYGDEYLDEVPLVGEPGSFIFSKNPTSGAAGAAGNTDQPTTTTSGAGASHQAGKSVSNTPAPGTAASPPVLKTDQATIGAVKKAGKSGEQTPTTPGTPGGAGGGKEKVKKRKNKAGLASS